MKKHPTLYLAIKRPQDKDYYIIASHKRPTDFKPLTCIDDFLVFEKTIIGFRHFTADKNSLNLHLREMTEALSTEEVTSEEMTLEGLVVFDFDSEVERTCKAEAYVFNSINIERKENTIHFDSESSHLRVEVGIDGERVGLISEPVEHPNCYTLGANVKL